MFIALEVIVVCVDIGVYMHTLNGWWEHDGMTAATVIIKIILPILLIVAAIACMVSILNTDPRLLYAQIATLAVFMVCQILMIGLLAWAAYEKGDHMVKELRREIDCKHGRTGEDVVKEVARGAWKVLRMILYAFQCGASALVLGGGFFVFYQLLRYLKTKRNVLMQGGLKVEKPV